ncbi:hypothetical protein JB92DRAFT_1962174 [Gautieria morchelliformis]|nr:hypothetical protein JB92DRAFT_1962174 [Gautieria morchelliformis]
MGRYHTSRSAWRLVGWFALCSFASQMARCFPDHVARLGGAVCPLRTDQHSPYTIADGVPLSVYHHLSGARYTPPGLARGRYINITLHVRLRSAPPPNSRTSDQIRCQCPDRLL